MKKKEDAAREAESTATGSELEGATKRIGATTKKQHDMQKQTIDNLK